MSIKKPLIPSSTPSEDQDRSIKARKSQLFDDSQHEIPVVTKKPFSEYLKTVPATPLSPSQRTIFWSIAGFIALLFLAAIFKRGR